MSVGPLLQRPRAATRNVTVPYDFSLGYTVRTALRHDVAGTNFHWPYDIYVEPSDVPGWDVGLNVSRRRHVVYGWNGKLA